MYKSLTNIIVRKEESCRMKERHPDRLPIIVEPRNGNISKIDKNKYMVPKDLLFGQLTYVIRKRIRLSKDQALFIFTNGKLITASSVISDVYNDNVDEDGFLYIVYDFENAFG